MKEKTSIPQKIIKFIIWIILCVGCFYLANSNFTKFIQIAQTYEDSNIKEFQGTVMSFKQKDDKTTIVNIQLDNQEKIKIKIDDPDKYPIGAEYTIYSNGTEYSFSKNTMILNGSGGINYFILTAVFLFAIIIICASTYGNKGVLFSILIIGYFVYTNNLTFLAKNIFF